MCIGEKQILYFHISYKKRQKKPTETQKTTMSKTNTKWKAMQNIKADILKKKKNVKLISR